MRRVLRLSRKYGIAVETYEAMWTAQAGKCANPHCDFTAPLDPKDYRGALLIDHCHNSKRVRGLLCTNCNTALGHAKDDVRRLSGLIAYLQSTG